MAPEVVDFAPGVSNVVARVQGTEFYSVETFHNAPFYNHITPVLVYDIVNSVDLLNLYGLSGMRALGEGVVMINNHPLRRLKIVGYIVEYFTKQFGDRVFYFLHLDDSSGNEMVVKITRAKLIESGIQMDKFENVLISVTGICKSFNNKLELDCECMEILSSNDIERAWKEQISFWKEVLEIRKKLTNKWVQKLQIDDDSQPLMYKQPIEKFKRREALRETNQILIPKDDQNMHIESSIYIQKQRTKQKDFVSISNYRPSLSTLPFNEQLAVLLLKWIIKKAQLTIDLNEPFQNIDIHKILEKKAEEMFPLQTVSLPYIHIKSINDLKVEIFHDSRQVLSKMRLIKSSKNGKVSNCAAALFFYEFIMKYCEQKRKLKLAYITGEFSEDQGIQLKIDYEVLNILITWMIRRADNYKYWIFNQAKKEWIYKEVTN